MNFTRETARKLSKKNILAFISAILLLVLPEVLYACSLKAIPKIMPFDLFLSVLTNLIFPSAIFIFVYYLLKTNDENGLSEDVKKASHRFLEYIVYHGLLLTGYLLIINIFIRSYEWFLFSLWSPSFLQTFSHIWKNIIQSNLTGLLLIIWAVVWAFVFILRQIKTGEIANERAAIHRFALKSTYNILIFPGLFWLIMWVIKLEYLFFIIPTSLVISILFTSVLFSMNQGNYRKSLIVFMKNISIQIFYLFCAFLIAYFLFGVFFIINISTQRTLNLKEIFIFVVIFIFILVVLYILKKVFISTRQHEKQKLRKIAKYFFYHFALFLCWFLIFNQLYHRDYQLSLRNEETDFEYCGFSYDYDAATIYPDYVRWPKPLISDQIETIIFSYFGFLFLYVIAWGIITPVIEYVWRKKIKKENVSFSKNLIWKSALLILWNIGIFIVIYLISRL